MPKLPRIGGVKVNMVSIEERPDYKDNSGKAIYDMGFEPTHVMVLDGRSIGAVDEHRRAFITKKYFRVGGKNRNIAEEIAPYCHNGLSVLC